MYWWPVTPVAIEAATDPDPGQLADIHAEGFPHAWTAADIAKLLNDDTVYAAIARRDSAFGSRNPVGFVLARLAADEAEILSIAVSTRYRRAGVGRKLMEDVLRHLFRERISRLFLEVDAENQAAVALYRKLGFKTVGERAGYYREGREKPATALVMRYDLR